LKAAVVGVDDVVANIVVDAFEVIVGSLVLVACFVSGPYTEDLIVEIIGVEKAGETGSEQYVEVKYEVVPAVALFAVDVEFEVAELDVVAFVAAFELALEVASVVALVAAFEVVPFVVFAACFVEVC
jgi:hypothetical protein